MGARNIFAKERRWRRLACEQEGFTLIELLVVLLIVGILLAIAIPTYLTVVGSANNTAAESNLTSAFEAVENYFVLSEGATSSTAGYGTASQAVSALNSQSHSGAGANDPLVFTTGPSNNPFLISVLTGSTLLNGYYDYVVISSYSNAGYCIDIFDNTHSINPPAPGIGVWYGLQGPMMKSCVPMAPPWTASPTFTYALQHYPPLP